MFTTSSSFVVALDANVLFGYPLRDTLLLAVEYELYRAAWSDKVWDEVLRNLQDPRRKRPHSAADMRHLMTEIRSSFPDAFITGYKPLEPAMLVNPKDQHVAAMAVRAGAQVLVTYNLKHFPGAVLEPYGIEVQHPDAFLMNLFERTPTTMVDVVRDQAARLQHPPKTPQALVDDLEQTQRIKRFARAIRPHL